MRTSKNWSLTELQELCRHWKDVNANTNTTKRSREVLDRVSELFNKDKEIVEQRSLKGVRDKVQRMIKFRR